jgi:hypothetical protein
MLCRVIKKGQEHRQKTRLMGRGMRQTLRHLSYPDALMPNRSFISYPILLSCTLLVLPAAQAGVLNNGAWTPAGCGAKPQAPSLDLRNADAYNRSVDAVNTYKVAIRQYLDCLVGEANADVQAVSKSANEAQRQAKETNDRIQADVKQADEKLK